MAPRSPIINAIRRAMPSVVSIRTATADEYTMSNDAGALVEQPEPQLGGSGFIVAPNGLIVTNKHVVPDPDAAYEVLLKDSTVYPARMVAHDPATDIAFLSIPKRRCPAMRLGSAKTLELGQEVVAIGNAFGQFTNTVSAGIVSGLSRSLVASLDQRGTVEELEGLIQTDAAINPGNSGGPLINLRGEAVGINIATVLGAQSLGFAIPIDVVRHDLDDLHHFKRIRRGYLGIRYIPITEAIAKEFKLDITHGALIASDATIPAVDPKSPAHRAGIRPNDIIIAVNGKEVSGERPLSVALTQAKIGKPLALTILRRNKRRRVSVTPSEWHSRDTSYVDALPVRE